MNLRRVVQASNAALRFVQAHTASPVNDNHHMPRGLVILPENKLLPLTPADIEAQATRNCQLLLGSAEAMWARREFRGTEITREEFDRDIWAYEL